MKSAALANYSDALEDRQQEQPVRAYRVTMQPIGTSAHFETIVYGTTRARADEAANKWLSGGDMSKVLKTVTMKEA